MFTREPSLTPYKTAKPLSLLIQDCDCLDKVSAAVHLYYWQPDHKNILEMQDFCVHIWKEYKILGQTLSWLLVELATNGCFLDVGEGRKTVGAH